MYNEEQLKKQIKELSMMLGGDYEELSTFDSNGKTSKKIIIEYSIETNQR